MSFFQLGPQLENQYKSDRVLKSYLKRVLPKEVLESVHEDLNRFGEELSLMCSKWVRMLKEINQCTYPLILGEDV